MEQVRTWVLTAVSVIESASIALRRSVFSGVWNHTSLGSMPLGRV